MEIDFEDGGLRLPYLVLEGGKIAVLFEDGPREFAQAPGSVFEMQLPPEALPESLRFLCGVNSDLQCAAFVGRYFQDEGRQAFKTEDEFVRETRRELESLRAQLTLLTNLVPEEGEMALAMERAVEPEEEGIMASLAKRVAEARRVMAAVANTIQRMIDL